tara:strand:+ start:124 stop:705 length:582 start_codon:yes stop_codon:yes gene_type:complete
MYCSSCGAELSSDFNFCGKCGLKVINKNQSGDLTTQEFGENIQSNKNRIDILLEKGFKIQTTNLLKSIVITPDGKPLAMISIPFTNKKRVNFESDFKDLDFPELSWFAFIFPMASSVKAKLYLNSLFFLIYLLICPVFSSFLILITSIYVRFIIAKFYPYFLYENSKKKITPNISFLVWIVGFFEVILVLNCF